MPTPGSLHLDGAGGQNLGALKSYILFSDLCRYFTKHLLESTGIWTIDTIHGWLLLDSFKCWANGKFRRLELKKLLIFLDYLGHFSFLESFELEQQVLYSEKQLNDI